MYHGVEARPVLAVLSSDSPLRVLEGQCETQWSNIMGALEAARVQRLELAEVLEDHRLTPADTEMVVLGSLARGEWTRGSDIDWTLLVDGQVDQSHLSVAHRIGVELTARGLDPPGPEQVFGNLVFSHQIVHRIGGGSDSNANTTQRILLLLESRTIGPVDEVRSRVMRQVYKRYIEDDFGYRALADRAPYVPRFLLNDIVRYWRTMAVDFAAKRRERDGKGWAIRNVKLRMSRKLIFVAGLAMCLGCKLAPSDALLAASESDDQFAAAITTYLMERSNLTPLELLAAPALQFEASSAGKLCLDSYDAFMAVLSDESKRERLKDLTAEAAASDSVLQECREIAESFQSGLTRLFFDSHEGLTEAAQRYGVF
jgi:predicted nucleotidyltransferase